MMLCSRASCSLVLPKTALNSRARYKRVCETRQTEWPYSAPCILRPRRSFFCLRGFVSAIYSYLQDMSQSACCLERKQRELHEGIVDSCTVHCITYTQLTPLSLQWEHTGRALGSIAATSLRSHLKLRTRINGYELCGSYQKAYRRVRQVSHAE
jgi:hypothetical protein